MRRVPTGSKVKLLRTFSGSKKYNRVLSAMTPLRKHAFIVCRNLAFVFFLTLLYVPGLAAQIPQEARREAVRLERLASNLWEAILEDIRFGGYWDQRTVLDVFNFANGIRHLNDQMERGQAPSKEVSRIVELLILQSDVVNRSLPSAKPSAALLRDWEATQASLGKLARFFTSRPTPKKPPATTGENVNELRIEIKDVRHTGNLFGSDYRIRGVISGRNIVAAGIYHKSQLLKSISVRLNDPRLQESSFAVRIEAPRGKVKVRVIDNTGFVQEKSVEFPTGGIFPGLR